MMVRTQISLHPEMQRRARRRANDAGLSLAEYVRRLVERDLGHTKNAADPASVFDLGASGNSDIARNKDAMIAEAYASSRKNKRGRRSA